MLMIRFIFVLLTGICASFYYFPVQFAAFPLSINSKMMMAGLGIGFFLLNALRFRAIDFSKELLGAVGLASLFSWLCMLSCDLNNSTDYSYATYIVSFLTWLMGAYALCELIRWVHGSCTLGRVTAYLTGVCVFQCLTALAIDANPEWVLTLTKVFVLDEAFYESIDRIFGIGAALDPAGCRFSLVLILIVYQLTHQPMGRLGIYSYWGAFFVIVGVGNIISRTTSIGAVIGLGLLAYALLFERRSTVLSKGDILVPFGVILVLGVSLFTYLYHTDATMHDNLRFAFEGFFNWVEHGELRTDSTDKLNNHMWIWPNTTFAWLMGTGYFDDFIYNTDIGYCRFVLYCGLVGLVTFSLFFIYNAWAVYHQHKIDRLLMVVFIALTFVIWVKVSTDIFVVYALLYCIDNLTPQQQQQQNL